MSLYKRSKHWCPKRPSSDFPPSRRAKAAVNMLRGNPTPVNSDDKVNSLPPAPSTLTVNELEAHPELIPPPLELEYIPSHLRYNPAEVSQQPYSSPTLSAVDSDRDSSHRRALSEDFNTQALPSPSLTRASTEEDPLIDLSDLDSHTEPSPEPMRNQFGNTFAELWNSTPPIPPSTDVFPADASSTDISPGMNSIELSAQRRLSRVSDISALSSLDSFYTTVSSPTAEMKHISTASGCVLPRPQILPRSSDKEAKTVVLPLLNDPSGVITGTANETIASKCLDDSPTPAVLPSELKDQFTEPKKVLLDVLRSGNSPGIPPPVISSISQRPSTAPQTVTKALPPPHLRYWNRFPDVTSNTKTSSVPSEKSTPATAIAKAPSPPEVDNVLPPPHPRVPYRNFDSVLTSTTPFVSTTSSGKASSSTIVSATLPSPQLRASNHMSEDLAPDANTPAVTSKNPTPEPLPPHLRVLNRLPGTLAQTPNISEKPHPLAKFQRLLPHQKKLKPFPKMSPEGTYIQAMYDSWDSASAWRYANSLCVTFTRFITETLISPGVTIRMGELCNVLVSDLPACNVNTFCLYFSTCHKGCKNRNKCACVHDERLRQLYLKQRKAERQKSIDGFITESLNTAIRQVAAKLEEITEGGANPPRSITYNKKTYASTTAAGLPPPPVVEKQPRKSWDHDEFGDWARNNLNPATVDKLMIPYIFGEHVPKRLLYSPSAKGEKTFYQFGSLPGEIRNQIWRLALLKESRDVKVRFTRHNTGNSIQPLDPPPSLLLVNHESRSLAQGYWTTIFDNNQNSCPAAVYFHFNQDRLWIHNQSSDDLPPMVNLMKSQHANYVKWISIPLRDFVAHPDNTIVALCSFKRVEQIWFVAGDSREDDTWVRQCPPVALNKKMKHLWAKCWKNSQHKNQPPKCHLEIIPALQARAMKIDGLCWL